MSANRKAPTTAAGPDHGATHEHLNVLYTAHQVHTLAQIVLQQITGSRSSAAPWAMSAGVACAYAGPGNGMASQASSPMGMGPGQGVNPAMPPALYYWYP